MLLLHCAIMYMFRNIYKIAELTMLKIIKKTYQHVKNVFNKTRLRCTLFVHYILTAWHIPFAFGFILQKQPSRTVPLQPAYIQS